MRLCLTLEKLWDRHGWKALVNDSWRVALKENTIMLSLRNNISAMSGITQFNQISRSQAKLNTAMASGKRILG